MRHSQADENDVLHDLLPTQARAKFSTLKDIKYYNAWWSFKLNYLHPKKQEINVKHSFYTVLNNLVLLIWFKKYECWYDYPNLSGYDNYDVLWQDKGVV